MRHCEAWQKFWEVGVKGDGKSHPSASPPGEGKEGERKKQGKWGSQICSVINILI